MDESRGEAVNLLASADAADRALGAFLLIGELLDDPMRASLRRLLRDPAPLVRETAAQALGSAADSDALEAIVALMDSVPPREGWGFAWAVCEIASSTTDSSWRMGHDALRRYLRRARGNSRQHAELLLARVKHVARP